MTKERLTAFSDGVIAVIITIMALEMKVPHGTGLDALWPLAPVFGSYVLSFVYVGIYWNNHHHLLYAARSIDGRILWANLHLLFWLSLIPFCSGWMGENHFETLPVALYGGVLLMCGIAYYILPRLLIVHHGHKSNLAIALGSDGKGIVSVLLYILAIVLAFFSPPAAFAIYVFVAAIWFIPDRRIETMLKR
jgi:TMEM175 potassium channel family protein